MAMDSSLTSPFATGFLLSASLIVAIGAQNMFVLRQGLHGTHVLAVVLFCGAADAVLVALGVGGLGAMLALVPQLARTLTLAGALFLAGYGARALCRMAAPDALMPTAGPAVSMARALGQTAAFTFLNPHVYLDTVLLMGAAGSGQAVSDRPIFVLGAATASFAWFALLGFGAQVVSPVFASPRTWRILDGLVGCTMLSLAAGLALRGFGPSP